MTSIYYADLTSEEIAEAAGTDPIVVLPTGCTEQQGPHLPVDVDSFLITALVGEAANLAWQEGIGVYVLPALPYGPAEEHMSFAGTISVAAETHARMVRDILESLIEHGFRRLVVAEGCGGHQLYHACLEIRARARQQRAKIRVWRIPAGGQAWLPLATEVFGEPPADLHAGEIVTSINLHLRPEAVREDRIPRLGQKTANDPSEPWFADEVSASGASGDPSRASAEAGRRLFEGIVQLYLERFRAIARTSI